tara:strand:+ start:654 stop:896 length:243 start_codon:yes stop_codon:yes gene_type:complete
MGEIRTIISANIPVSLAMRLKNKTKGTRSRVIARALKAYLDEEEAFNITDWDSRNLLAVLHSRNDISDTLKLAILMELNS